MATLNKIFFCVGVGFCFSLLFLFPNTALAEAITEDSILQEINIQRQYLELKPLTVNSVLYHVADLRAQDMFINNYFSHKSPAGLMPWDIATMENYDYSILGENLALDYYDTDQVINDWMASPDHRNNILNPQYTETGIKVMQNSENLLIVQIFARPRLFSPFSNDNSIKEQSIVSIIPNNPDPENLSVLGTYNIHKPEISNTININIQNLWILLIATGFYVISGYLLLFSKKM